MTPSQNKTPAPPSVAATSGAPTEATPLAVHVPTPPQPHALRFYVQVGAVERPNLNVLFAEENCDFWVIKLALGHEQQIYPRFEIDLAGMVVRLFDPNGVCTSRPVTLSLAKITPEEVAALRFLDSMLGGPTAARTHAWRTHLIEKLAEIVPIFDFDNDAVNISRAVAVFRAQTVLN